jgi:hypothetical protein
MRVNVSADSVEVLLSPWEKALGLMGNIKVPREHVSDVHVIRDPMRETIGTGLKVGLRLPGIRYVARSIRLDEAFLVRRRVPALSFAVENHGALKRVLACTPDAEELARRLNRSERS